MLEETGYLSHNSERVCLLIFTSALPVELNHHQFCAAFQLFIPFFVIFSGESIRREYTCHTLECLFVDGEA